MADKVVIEGVILRGDDLNVVWSPWRSVNRANNLRLVPIALGFIASGGMLGSRLDPGALDTLLIVSPVLIGWLVFIWMTNAVFLGEYKKSYAAAPVGADPCTFTFDANGMHQTMPRGTSSYRWSAFVEIVEDVRGVRLWMTPFMAVFIPACFINEQQAIDLHGLIEAARERAEIRGVPER